ncbi:MAG: hypothetical protein ACKVQK_08290 [Burkholderiales bacterium]
MTIIGEALAKWGVTRLADFLFKLIGKACGNKPVPNWEATIERLVPDIRIYGLVPEEPRLELLGPYRATNEQRKAADLLRPTLDENDPHAMLVEEPELIHSPVHLRANTLDYALLEVLRNEKKHQHIVSAGALVVCQKARTLVLHHRSKDSRTFDGCIHITGGAYWPPNVIPRKDRDALSLKATARREVMEETGAAIDCDGSAPMLLAQERSERFFQFVLLGSNISPTQLRSLKENWEGKGIIKVGYDELRAYLVSPPKPWVPSGKGHVLAWLALGAPGGGWMPRFGKLTPQELFLDIVSLSA